MLGRMVTQALTFLLDNWKNIFYNSYREYKKHILKYCYIVTIDCNGNPMYGWYQNTCDNRINYDLYKCNLALQMMKLDDDHPFTFMCIQSYLKFNDNLTLNLIFYKCFAYLNNKNEYIAKYILYIAKNKDHNIFIDLNNIDISYSQINFLIDNLLQKFTYDNILHFLKNQNVSIGNITYILMNNYLINGYITLRKCVYHIIRNNIYINDRYLHFLDTTIGYYGNQVTDVNFCLCLTAEYGNYDMCELLLERYNAIPHIANQMNGGRGARTLAKINRYDKIVTLLDQLDFK